MHSIILVHKALSALHHILTKVLVEASVEPRCPAMTTHARALRQQPTMYKVDSIFVDEETRRLGSKVVFGFGCGLTPGANSVQTDD